MRLFAGLMPAVLLVSAISATGEPAYKSAIDAVTFDDAPPAVQDGVPAAMPFDGAEKLGWIVWTWDEQTRRDPGQTFRVEKDLHISGVSVLIASAENMNHQSFLIEFEEYADVEADVAPAREMLAIYRGVLPADFDRQSPGRWVTFRLKRPMKLKRNGGYAFRLAFEEPRDYELRRCFLRTTYLDADGKPHSALPGRMIHQTGETHYAVWGSIEDMIFVLRTD